MQSWKAPERQREIEPSTAPADAGKRGYPPRSHPLFLEHTQSEYSDRRHGIISLAKLKHVAQFVAGGPFPRIVIATEKVTGAFFRDI